jgi:hypothetical protein
MTTELAGMTKIEKANAKFQALSDKKKRIAIAKDVLKQVEAEKYLPTVGIYFYIDLGADVDPVPRGADVQKVLRSSNAKCEVCAVGAAFASAARLGNNLFYKTSREAIAMDRIFEGHVDSMEHAFEGCDSSNTREKMFFKKYKDAADRLVAIFQNIIDNDGEFTP